MRTIDTNGLVYYTEAQIKRREYIVEHLRRHVQITLLSTNPAWHMERIEAPCLIPDKYLSKEYSEGDYYTTLDDLSLRPETTPGTYLYADHVINMVRWLRPPICFWQVGKSFRREQTAPLTKMKLKEFYQCEFQCIYSPESKADYHNLVVQSLADGVAALLNKSVITEPSDRLPSYSERTTDLILDGMEIASISTRKDFPNYKVLELAFGIDRILYHWPI